jgi:hypothetical protein
MADSLLDSQEPIFIHAKCQLREGVCITDNRETRGIFFPRFRSAPPLIVLVVLLTSNPAIMGRTPVHPCCVRLGWATAVIMTAAGIGMLVTL